RYRPVLPAALVDAADVEARRHGDPRAERGETLCKFERRVAEVDRAVDVRLRDIHQLARTVDAGHADEDRHGELRRRTVVAVQHRAVAFGEDQHDASASNYNPRMRNALAIVTATFLLAPLASAQNPPATVTVVKPARVFDGDTMHEGWAVRVK